MRASDLYAAGRILRLAFGKYSEADSAGPKATALTFRAAMHRPPSRAYNRPTVYVEDNGRSPNA